MALSESPAGRVPVVAQLGRGIDAGLTRLGLGNARLALPVVLYLLAVVIPIHFKAGPLNMTGVRLLLLVMVIPLAVNLLSGKYGKVLLTDILVFAHILWALLSLAVNNPAQVVTNIGSTGVEFIGGYLLARACIRTPEDFVALIRWLVLITFCLLPFALIESQTGRPLILEAIRSIPGISSVKPVNIGGRLGMERAQTVFAHPIHSGLFFAITFALVFSGMKGLMSPVMRLAAALSAGVCGFLALSSGALLALILQLALIGWAWVFRNMRRKWLLLLGLFVCLYIGIDLLSNRSPIRVFMSYATFSAHTAYWRSIIFEWGMVNVWANPLLGVGLNDWVRPSYMVSGSMDNFWLVMAVRYGIPGFATLAAGYLILLWKVGRRDFDSDPLLLNLRRAWVFCMVGLTLTLVTVHIWHTIYSFVFFIFGAGAWMLQAQPRGAAPAPAGPDAGAGPQNNSRGGGARQGAPLRSPDPAPRRQAAALPEREVPSRTQEALVVRQATLPLPHTERAEPRYSRFAPRTTPPRTTPPPPKDRR